MKRLIAFLKSKWCQYFGHSMMDIPLFAMNLKKCRRCGYTTKHFKNGERFA